MKAPQFDALARTVWARGTRRGFTRGAVLLTAGFWATVRGPGAAEAQEFWPCPDGVDGHRRDCLCECRRFTNATSPAACQAACGACKGHVTPVCFDVDERGDPTGTPICCADRKPCRRLCGDCPDCEPLPDLL